MQLYKCKVHHGGSLYNEIRKSGVTIPEIMILRIIHGGDAGSDVVVDIEANGECARLDKETMTPADYKNPDPKRDTIPWNDANERERLERRYRLALSKNKETPTVRALFGLGALPTTLDGVTPSVVDEQHITRTRVPRRKEAVQADELRTFGLPNKGPQADDFAELGAA